MLYVLSVEGTRKGVPCTIAERHFSQLGGQKGACAIADRWKGAPFTAMSRHAPPGAVPTDIRLTFGDAGRAVADGIPKEFIHQETLGGMYYFLLHTF